MNVLLEKTLNTIHNKKIILLALSVFLFLELILAGTLVGKTLAYNKIYKGIYINDVNVSGLTRDEAESFLRNTYEPRFKSMQIVINSSGNKEEIKPEELVDSPDFTAAVNNAYNEGRTGSFISRIYNISKNASSEKTIPLKCKFDEGKIQQLIGKYYLQVRKELVQNSYQIYEDKIIVTLGTHGESLDEAALRKKLSEIVESFKSGEIELPISVEKLSPFDIDQLYKKVYTKAADATYKVENYKLSMVPEVIGRDFDVEKAKELLKAQSKEGSRFEIPLSLTYPKIYEEELQKTFFTDTLSSFSTHYNTSDRDRSENIRLASGSINGAVIAPGDVFSYNEVVGKRSADRGYKEAHVYVGGRITNGIGGGICQVSTTLYNAVLFADLQVVSRRNHNMTVAYVPPGRDATVTYGGTDFQFKNNYKNPIKVLTFAKGGKLSIEILGVDENPSKEIKLETQIVEAYPYKEIVTSDKTKPVGYYKVEQKGMRGYKVNTYKIVKINGKTISRTLISTSKYIPSNRRVIKGTKVVKNNTAPVSQSQPLENTN